MKRQTEKLFFVLTGPLSKQSHGFLFSSESDTFEELGIDQLNEKLVDGGHALTNLVIAVPGQEVLQIFLDAPKLSGKKLQSALYWMAENHVSTPMENNQFFWKKHATENMPMRCLASVVEKTQITEWQNILDSLGLAEAELTTLGQLLLHKKSTALVWQNNLFFNDQNCLSVFSMGNQPELPQHAGEVSEITAEAVLEHLRNRLKPSWINFGFSQDKQSGFKNFPIKSLGIGIAASLLLVCSYFWLMGLTFQKEAAQISDQAIAQYRQWFPNEQRVVNVHRQLEGKLTRGSDSTNSTGVSVLLNTLALSLEQSINNFNVERIRFHQTTGTLQVVLIVEKIDDISGLTELMTARQIDLDIQSATRKSNGLEVGLILTPGF